MEEHLQIPETAPVMVLPGCNFFPHTPLALHIFEARYRTMLALALEGDRMFCIGTRCDEHTPGIPFDSEAGIFRSGTIGLVRACVKTPDGTSNLILEGLHRVIFRDWARAEPFRVAYLETVATDPGDPGRVREKLVRVMGLVGALVERGIRRPPQLDLRVDSALGAEIVADIVASCFVMDLEPRQVLLGIESLEGRLDFLAEQLKGVLGSLGPPA